MKKIILASIAVLILTACADQTPTQTSSAKAKSYDPCQLLTQADVAELFPNGEITLDQHDTEANPIGMKVCFYSTSSEDQSFAQLAVTSVVDAPTGIVDNGSLAPLFESEKEFVDASIIQEVSGLGTSAYYGGSGLKPGAGLHVLDDAHGVKIDITAGLGFGNDDQTAHLEIEKKIAEKALSRL